MIERLSTVLPDPDSPTTPSASPRLSVSDTPSTARDEAALGEEVGLEVVEDEERAVGLGPTRPRLVEHLVAVHSDSSRTSK